MTKELSILMILGLLMTACAPAPASEAPAPAEGTGTPAPAEQPAAEPAPIPYGDITVDQVARVLAENPEVILLDVRTLEENQADALPDSVVIPVQELPDRLGELDKEQQYLVYCRSGNRSSQAVKILKDAGFGQLFHMTGGMLEYRRVFPKP